MHPAFSVVFFTTASGAGYGLLFLLGVLAAAGLLPPDPVLGVVCCGLALGLISAGLLSSTAHLGRPERAWRAFSQWRSSWLSREGVAASATYLPAVGFAAGWVFFGQTSGWVAALGVLSAAGAVVTVCMTGMIYASLQPVAQWHTPLTVPGYLIYSAATGLTILTAIFVFYGTAAPVALFAAAAIAVAWVWKLRTWAYDAALPARSQTTPNTATGLEGGTVRSVEWPHTERNYLLKEMGFRIGRKHSAKLRRLTQLFAFALPLVLLAASFGLSGNYAAAAAVLAAVVQFAGMLVERWLFFAEATHTVTLYYGR